MKKMNSVVMSNLPLVSIVIPCRNEEKFIGMCLDSITANDYPKDKIEVLIVDGVSEDGTREIVVKYVQQYPFIKILDNPKKNTPCALNIGIKNAKGEVITRMDAHTTYERDYVSKCVKYLKEHNADNVGGIWKIFPKDNTIISKGVVQVLSRPFGIGNAYYRFTNNKEPMWVDAVPFFCCKKEIFERVGIFNENLIRGQDMEFNLRLKKMGARILLVPEIVSCYYARSDLKSFITHNFINGLWAILPFKYTNIIPVSVRHLVPLGFVLTLFGALILSLFWDFFWWIFLFVALSYIVVNFYFSLAIAVKERDGRLIFTMPVIFAILHFSYGLGSVFGVVKCVFSRSFRGNLRVLITNR